MRKALLVCLVISTLWPSGAQAASWLIPPVDGPIVRRFEPPNTTWGPGHRGIDYSVVAGTAVRAAGAGTVTFAGPVAGVLAVTIAHGGGLETTYSDLSEVTVATGDVVTQGSWLGRTDLAHSGASSGLHLGVKLDGAYVDPESFIGPLGLGDSIRLAPLVWEPPGTLPAVFRAPFLTAEAPSSCRTSTPGASSPPNDNVVVLVAGIGSKTAGGVSAKLYESGASSLGYAPADAYAFSYRSTAGPRLHEPYARADTFSDITVAARRLRDLMEEVARRHPGRAVDLIVHSQGGIVARSYLQLVAGAWDPALPRVDHLVTFSTPHEGAPLAGQVDAIDATPVGRALLAAGSWWAGHGGPLPDPYAPSVGQLAPGSELLGHLDRSAVLFGTKVLSLGIANDVVVPADRSGWAPYRTSIVGPEGLNGHDAVVSSDSARAIAHSFLRDAAPACRGGWDLWGPRVGRAVSAVEGAIGSLHDAVKW